MTFKVENTVWNWRKSRTRNEIFRAQYTIELNLKCRQRENDISEDHWTWPKYCKEDNYGKARVEDGHIVLWWKAFHFSSSYEHHSWSATIEFWTTNKKGEWIVVEPPENCCRQRICHLWQSSIWKLHVLCIVRTTATRERNQHLSQRNKEGVS